MLESIVIVGGGQAAGNCARALREAGFAGSLTVVGEECFPPYERPPLSKSLLAGRSQVEDCFILPMPWYAENNVTLLLGARAVAIDKASKQVQLDDGRRVSYDALVLATGASPRRLPQADPLNNTFYIRTIEDTFLLRARLVLGHRVAVIGAGFIGLEVAATAREAGADVTVIEIADDPMARVAPPELGKVYSALHRRHGVAMLTSTSLSGVKQEGKAARLTFSDGSEICVDTIVVGVGILPNVELAAAAGLQIDDGIVVDEFGRTSHPDIWAIGDCCAFWHPGLRRRVRLESWQHAQNHGVAVANNLLGNLQAYNEVPWAWTDQYGINLQIAGLPKTWDRVVWRGNPASSQAIMFQVENGTVVGGATMNQPREMRFLRKMVAARTTADYADLTDHSRSLKELAS